MRPKSHAHRRKDISNQGAATSAATVSRKTGVKKALIRWVWIGGSEQQWVPWTEIEAQVAEAYRQWRIRMSLRGVRIMDAAERAENDISEALKKRKQ